MIAKSFMFPTLAAANNDKVKHSPEKVELRNILTVDVGLCGKSLKEPCRTCVVLASKTKFCRGVEESPSR